MKLVTEAVSPEGLIDSHPSLVEHLDYEAELAVIIGKTAKNVKAADASALCEIQFAEYKSQAA